MTETHEDHIERFINEFRTKCEKLAHARARCRKSENAKKRILALAMRAAEVRGFKTAAAQLREAEASEVYEKWADEDVAALLEREILSAEIESDKLRWETWRTRSADRRAEMGMR